MAEAANTELNSFYNFLHEGISSVVAISNEILSLPKGSSTTDILNLITEKLIQLDYFDSFAFYEIKDLIDFQQTHCYPESARELIEKDVEQHIDNGTFSWALNNTRPVVINSAVSGYNQALVSLSTKRRIHGMFIANAKNKGEIHGVTLDILQLIISIVVFSIDNLQLVEQLTDYTHNLESKVNERTKELEEAMVRAEQSSKARSEFLANMSHEIRTPMNGVLGMLELLTETTLNKKQTHYVTTAQNSGNNMLVILNDILDLSKVESGKLVIEDEEFNLHETIENLSSLFASELQGKGVELIVDIDPAIPAMLVGGQTRFWQVIMNLVGNAKKFTEQGEITLALTLKDRVDDDIDLAVSVKDSGIGIAEDALAKVFESFEQAEVNTSRQYGGTGLGLTLCKKLTNMMGGDINLTSTLGEGSDFYFNVKMKALPGNDNVFATKDKHQFNVLYLCENEKLHKSVKNVFKTLNINGVICQSIDLMKSELDSLNESSTNILLTDEADIVENGWDIEELKNRYIAYDIEMAVVCNEATKDKYSEITGIITKPLLARKLFRFLQSVVGDSDTAQTGKKVLPRYSANVLIVDDNDVNQMVATGMFKNIGCNITTANNGAVALELLQDNNFDVAFMDINMPVLSGPDATRQFRENEAEGEHFPIIALTANILPEDVASYIEAGMDDYVFKPYTAETLCQKLEKWASHTRVDDTASASNSSQDSNNTSINTDVIEELKNMMGEEGYAELVDTFINRCQDLKKAIFTNLDDNEQLVMSVHSLKGSSGTMGAKKLFEICEVFERDLRAGNKTDNQAEYEKISAELDAVEAYLTTNH